MSRTLAKVATRALLVIVILGLAAWAALALYLGPPQSVSWATALAAAGLTRMSVVIGALSCVFSASKLRAARRYSVRCRTWVCAGSNGRQPA